jgi:hypothetical protein
MIRVLQDPAAAIAACALGATDSAWESPLSYRPATIDRP